MYHSTNIEYRVGDKISNTYFREYLNSLADDNRQKLVEDFFEYNRPNNKISRLDSIFAFRSSTHCENYAMGRRRFIYRIVPTNPELISIHNFKVISYFLGIDLQCLPDLNHNIDLVVKYWHNFSGTHWIDHVNVPIYRDEEMRRLMGANWNEDEYIEEVLIGCPAIVKEVFHFAD